MAAEASVFSVVANVAYCSVGRNYARRDGERVATVQADFVAATGTALRVLLALVLLICPLAGRVVAHDLSPFVN